jgi:lipopolysaccharide transport system ATP-binding protein
MSAITVNGLSKMYRLQNKGTSEFDALRDVSFRVDEGESVGIIGHNGAGKSTLLKILSGITNPSSGDGKVVGSFSSLLEVGIGFHPDLTGRDNIFFNASILGVSRAAIQKEMELIIAFSGVEKFIDQPLRTYSSGMKLRLAFAIIAHLKTDIIALDEVLAVGDSMFQVKCMERIFDFKNQGRTILFVSHNLSAVKRLCDRTLVLENGKLIFDGPTNEAISTYLNRVGQIDAKQKGLLTSYTLDVNETVANIELVFDGIPADSEVDLGVNIRLSNGETLYHFSNRFDGSVLKPESGNLTVNVAFNHQLKPGIYPVAVFLGQNDDQLMWTERAFDLTIPPHAPYGFHNPDSIQGPMITEFTIKKI